MRQRIAIDLGGWEDLGGVGKVENTVIRIYYIKYLFSTN